MNYNSLTLHRGKHQGSTLIKIPVPKMLFRFTTNYTKLFRPGMVLKEQGSRVEWDALTNKTKLRGKKLFNSDCLPIVLFWHQCPQSVIGHQSLYLHLSQNIVFHASQLAPTAFFGSSIAGWTNFGTFYVEFPSGIPSIKLSFDVVNVNFLLFIGQDVLHSKLLVADTSLILLFTGTANLDRGHDTTCEMKTGLGSCTGLTGKSLL